MSHHEQGEHSGATHGSKSHLPPFVKRIGVVAILAISVGPIIDGLSHANWIGVFLWCLIADLLCQFVWEWS